MASQEIKDRLDKSLKIFVKQFKESSEIKDLEVFSIRVNSNLFDTIFYLNIEENESKTPKRPSRKED